LEFFALSTLLLARSFVQDQVVVSSAEDDYYASSSAVKDIEYLRHLLQGLHIFPDDTSSPTVLVDSLQAIAMSQGLTHCFHTFSCWMWMDQIDSAAQSFAVAFVSW
jgi:hypothetical protein